MKIKEQRMSSFVDRGNQLIADGKTADAMKLVESGLQHYTKRILKALTPYAAHDAGLIVLVLRHVADEVEKNNKGAKEFYEGMKGIVIAPDLKESAKVKRPNQWQ